MWRQDSQANRAKIGETFTIDCPAGGEADTVWGAGFYADDSSICTAGVQSGLITFVEGGKVTYEVAAAEERYDGGLANGVTSKNYGSWGGSFTFPDAPPGSVTFEVGPESWTQTANSVELETASPSTCSGPGHLPGANGQRGDVE
ncbi:MAG: LCCL domain-containing protein [Aquihabitans sp.]